MSSSPLNRTDLDNIVAADQPAQPEKQAAPQTKIAKNLEGLASSTQQRVSTTVVVGTNEDPQGISEKKFLSPDVQQALLSVLKSRFEVNKQLHPNTNWSDVEKALHASPETLWSLQQLERTGGEPDVFLDEQDAFVFGDCSVESPSGRRDVVFRKRAEDWLMNCQALPKREIVPNGNAADRVTEWGVEFMDEAQYRALQELGTFDCQTSSWLESPVEDMRALLRRAGLAMHGYRRYDMKVMVREDVDWIHAPSIGFRCVLRVKKV